jgi:dTDP-L-rhamnose 4-epimerase
MHKSVLITGGAGFIGLHVARKLLQMGCVVRVVDNFHPQIHDTNLLPSDLADDIHLIRCDIRDPAWTSTSLKGIDAVLHLAAETGTGQSMYAVRQYFDVNVQGTALLLEELQRQRQSSEVSNVVVASSRAIYGEGAYQCLTHGVVYPRTRKLPDMQRGDFEPRCPVCNGNLTLLETDESAPFQPQSVYGLTKQVQEQAVLMATQTMGIAGTALRYQNVYGPGQSLKNPYTGILAIFSNLARQGLPISIYEDGNESRDFVFIDDVVNATISALTQTTPSARAINVGSGCGISVAEVAKQINAYFGKRSEITVTGDFRIGDIRHNVAKLDAAFEAFGYRPAVKFSDGLRSFLDWASERSVVSDEAYRRSNAELSELGLLSTRSKQR